MEKSYVGLGAPPKCSLGFTLFQTTSLPAFFVVVVARRG